MASTSSFVFPAEGLDYLLGVVPKAGTTPANLYLGLFTTPWNTVLGYGTANIGITLNTGTQIVNELASATGYTVRKTIASTDWGAASAGTATIGGATINVRQITTSGAYVFTNGGASAWTNIYGMFIASAATVGQASGAGTTVLWYAPFTDLQPVTLAVGDSLSITPTWQSAPYPA